MYFLTEQRLSLQFHSFTATVHCHRQATLKTAIRFISHLLDFNLAIFFSISAVAAFGSSIFSFFCCSRNSMTFSSWLHEQLSLRPVAAALLAGPCLPKQPCKKTTNICTNYTKRN